MVKFKLCSGIPDMSAYIRTLNLLLREIAVGLSGYLNGVNPFDQPGVSIQKNMFGKSRPGFGLSKIKRTSIMDMPHSQYGCGIFVSICALIRKRTAIKGIF